MGCGGHFGEGGVAEMDLPALLRLDPVSTLRQESESDLAAPDRRAMIGCVRERRWMVVVWGCFLTRLLFYSAMLPLWEGFDEWAHFAVVRHIVVEGQPLVSREAPVSRDIEISLAMAPVPWEMRDAGLRYHTQDAYWSSSQQDRDERQLALQTMPAEWGREVGGGRFTAYEALQAPLYYWLMAPALWIFQTLRMGLAAEVLGLRALSSLLASLIVPLVFLTAREVWRDARLAVGCAAIAAVMPELALDVARVGNDSLSVVLFTLLLWLSVRSVQRGLTPRLAAAIGIAFGAGLLTKAYFLTALPAVLAVLAYGWWRGRDFRVVLLGLLAIPIAGWWYWRNLRLTGTLSGLSEAVTLQHAGTGEMARQASTIPWARAIDSIVFSHLYFGGWSSLTVRSWMYHLFYAVIFAAMLGLARKQTPALLTLLGFYVCFWLGELYNVTLLFMSKGLAGSMGWYLYAVTGAEVTLCVAGLRRLLPDRWILTGGAALFALLDLYTVHAVAIPYYTGMIRHRPNGTLEALHWASFQSVGVAEAVVRLTAFKSAVLPASLLVVLWAVYILATVTAVAAASARECDSAANRQG